MRVAIADLRTARMTVSTLTIERFARVVDGSFAEQRALI
jgi:hypothetical protein